MYLLAALAHPKGLNARNDVAHGLLPESEFSKALSERVVHALFAVSMIRLKEKATTTPAGAESADHAAG